MTNAMAQLITYYYFPTNLNLISLDNLILFYEKTKTIIHTDLPLLSFMGPHNPYILFLYIYEIDPNQFRAAT